MGCSGEAMYGVSGVGLAVICPGTSLRQSAACPEPHLLFFLLALQQAYAHCTASITISMLGGYGYLARYLCNFYNQHRFWKDYGRKTHIRQ